MVLECFSYSFTEREDKITERDDVSGHIHKETYRNTSKKIHLKWYFLLISIILFLFIPIFLLLLSRFSGFHPISTLMLKDRILGQSYQRQWVPLEDMSPALVNAVLVSEDGQFCSHYGIDWQALGEVITDKDGPQRGASTITMQMVKNLFLWQGRSYIRKAIELPLAFGAEMLLSKRRIMEIYLNIIEWGPGIYGAEKAARYYFGHSAKTLTSWEGALLAATLPNPENRNPVYLSKKHAALARLIAKRAQHSGAYRRCLQ